MKITLKLMLCFLCSIAQGQTSYGHYDSQTTDYEVRLAGAQQKANSKEITTIQLQQKRLSLFSSQESIQRSRLQALINAKDNENFRLNQKTFALTDSKVIRDKVGLNSYRKQYPLFKVTENILKGPGSYRLSNSAEDFSKSNGHPVYAEDLK